MPRARYDRIRPTFIESWPAAVAALSVPQRCVRLSDSEIGDLLAAHHWSLVNGQIRESAALRELQDRLDAAVKEFPGGAIVRTGVRSPKDSPAALRDGLRVVDARAALLRLAQSSRVVDDLRLQLHHGDAPRLFARRWVEWEPWTELRCFMRGRRLIGVSQYDCKGLGFQPALVERAGELHQAVRGFFEEFRSAVHLDDVVFDVAVVQGRAVLIELNPFSRASDACLFDWDHLERFDGSFRCVQPTAPRA